MNLPRFHLEFPLSTCRFKPARIATREVNSRRRTCVSLLFLNAAPVSVFRDAFHLVRTVHLAAQTANGSELIVACTCK